MKEDIIELYLRFMLIIKMGSTEDVETMNLKSFKNYINTITDGEDLKDKISRLLKYIDRKIDHNYRLRGEE